MHNRPAGCPRRTLQPTDQTVWIAHAHCTTDSYAEQDQLVAGNASPLTLFLPVDQLDSAFFQKIFDTYVANVPGLWRVTPFYPGTNPSRNPARLPENIRYAFLRSVLTTFGGPELPQVPNPWKYHSASSFLNRFMFLTDALLTA